MGVLFQRGAFTAASAALSAQSLAAFALGLPAFVLVKVLAPGFFARGDTATPVKIGTACVALNFALNLVLMRPLQHVGPALATSVAAWANLGLLAWVLFRRGQFAPDAQLRSRAPRMLAAALFMAAVLRGAERTLWAALDRPHGLRYAAMALLVALGAASYFGVAAALRAFDARDLMRTLRRGRRPAARPGPSVP